MSRKLPRVILACLLAAVAITLTGCDAKSVRGMAENFGAKQVEQSTDEEVLEMFAAAKQMCPMRMDTFTTLYDIKVLDNKNIEYHYKVSEQGSMLVAQMDMQTMRKRAVEAMKKNKMAVAVAERDLSIQHIYADHGGAIILSYTINQDVLDGRDPVGKQHSNPFMTKQVKSTGDNSHGSTPKAIAPYQPAPGESNPAGIQGNPFFSG